MELTLLKTHELKGNGYKTPQSISIMKDKKMKGIEKKIFVKQTKERIMQELTTILCVVTLISYGYFVWLMFFATERQ